MHQTIRDILSDISDIAATKTPILGGRSKGDYAVMAPTWDTTGLSKTVPSNAEPPHFEATKGYLPSGKRLHNYGKSPF